MPPPLELSRLLRDLPALGTLTSTAETANTVAITGTLTHSITLLAVS